MFSQCLAHGDCSFERESCISYFFRLNTLNQCCRGKQKSLFDVASKHEVNNNLGLLLNLSVLYLVQFAILCLVFQNLVLSKTIQYKSETSHGKIKEWLRQLSPELLLNDQMYQRNKRKANKKQKNLATILMMRYMMISTLEISRYDLQKIILLLIEPGFRCLTVNLGKQQTMNK